MAKLAFFVSATFVLFFPGPAIASPEEVMPPAPKEKPAPVRPLDSDLSLAPAPEHLPPAPPPDARYYTHQQALTFRFGDAAEFSDFKFDDRVIGFQYLFPKFLSPKVEAGADLHEDGIGHVHAGMRWIAWERSYFRPSAKAGLDLLTDSRQGLATIGYVNNYSLRLTGTLEYTFMNPYSVRLEPEVLLGLKSNFLELTLGINRGW